jgi:hypothetical protein
MSYTLFDLTHRVAKELKILVDGVASGGSTSTLLDANDRTEADNYWLDGSLWLWYDAGALGAAPEGEMTVLNSSTSSTGTLTFRDNFTVAPASGDKYSVARKVRTNIPWMPILIQNVNQALQDLGPIPQIDVTTVTIASNQSEYSIPIQANLDLRRVFLQTTIDANQNDWIELANWHIEPGTPGNAGTLVLPLQESSGYAVRLDYMDYHPEMQVGADVMSDHVPIERVVYPAALECLEWLRELWNGDAKYDRAIDRMQQKVAKAEAYRRIRNVPTKPGHVTLVDWKIDNRPLRSYPGDRNPR